MVVEVNDGAKTGTTTVEVSVTSVNDATPAWSTTPSSPISVDENTDIGTSITSVTATDADYGEHGNITYSIATVVGGEKYPAFKGQRSYHLHKISMGSLDF